MVSWDKENQWVQIDRSYHHHGWQFSHIHLHIFCDASESGYGAVADLRFAFKSETTHCCFIMEKSRFAQISAKTGVKCCRN